MVGSSTLTDVKRIVSATENSIIRVSKNKAITRVFSHFKNGNLTVKLCCFFFVFFLSVKMFLMFIDSVSTKS